MVNELLSFGLGAALIGSFFIPFINTQSKKIDSKDTEIGVLNRAIQELLEQRLVDASTIHDKTLEPIREFNTMAEALFKLVRKRHER